ncbi:hypothetical protein FNV43_RR05245 [Rhamnella rubrinervis]|uniref:Uncharacterized protein n=1 Tax=Rhamnella rubrinervis TaxID=2594499 RepID=A0A8K0HL91_9ROSA|nr:hypothetical protein FNV43_RR05245 [Rhamnella rubrinervis]
MQKRQKQYFEQRRRQQQGQQQTAGLESCDDGIDISEQHQKETRSLDVLSLLHLSTIAQECKSARLCGETKDVDGNASLVEFDITVDPPEILSSTVAAANCVEVKEARIPSSLQMDTKSPKKVSFSAPDNLKNAFDGVDSISDQWNTASEQQFSLFDLLDDDGLNGNKEESPVHEPHVAFSVKGLGKVGMETPVHSPQQPNRTFSYGCSPTLKDKDARQLKSSKNLNSFLDDLECDVDAMMQDINLPFSSSSLEFSVGIMDPLSSPKEKSFTVRDSRNLDGCSSKVNNYFGHRKIFDEDESNSEGKWNGPSASYPKHHTPEFDHDFLNSNWARHQTVGGDFDFRHVTSQPDKFCFGKEDATDNFSLLSEESCSSSAGVFIICKDLAVSIFILIRLTKLIFPQIKPVRGKATDNSRQHSTSIQSRRKHENSFCGLGETKGGKKIFDKETQYKGRDDISRGNFVCGSEKCPSMLNPSYSKPSHHSNTFFQENLGPKNIWSFEEGCSTDNIFPGSSSFNQHSGRKHPSFGSKSFNEDPYSKLLAQKIHFGAKSSIDGFEHCEPIGCSPSGSNVSKTFALHESSILSKPDFPLDSELRGIPSDSSLAAGSHCESQSLNLSAQESVSEDVKHKEKLQPAKHEKFNQGKNICIGSEGLLKKDKLETDASSSKKIDCERREASLANPLLEDFIDTTLLHENAEETSPYVEIPHRFQSINDEKEDHHDAKSPPRYQKNHKVAEYIDPEGKMVIEQQSECVNSSCQVVMLQSYVFQLLCVQKFYEWFKL